MKHCLQQIKTDIKYRSWNIQLTGNHLQCLCQSSDVEHTTSCYLNDKVYSIAIS